MPSQEFRILFITECPFSNNLCTHLNKNKYSPYRLYKSVYPGSQRFIIHFQQGLSEKLCEPLWFIEEAFKNDSLCENFIDFWKDADPVSLSWWCEEEKGWYEESLNKTSWNIIFCDIFFKTNINLIWHLLSIRALVRPLFFK